MSGAGPTIGGFQQFITNVMAPPPPFNVVTSPYVQYAYDFAIQFCNPNLQCVPGLPNAWSLYAMAVYNLAADALVNFAQDPEGAPPVENSKPPTPYWQYLRNQYGVLNFVPGVLSSSSDDGTSASYQVAQQFANYTIANLQNLKTPYGRQYLAIAGSWGTLWGVS